MKIGYFITTYPYKKSFTDREFSYRYPVFGGEICAYNLAKIMACLGHKVSVFTAASDSHDQVEKSDGLTVFRYGTNLKINKAFFSFSIFRESVKHDLDIVHLHFTTPPGNLAGFYYSIAKNKPLIITYHGDGDPNYGSLIRRVGTILFNKFAVDRILKRSKFIIALSEHYIDQSHFLPKYRNKIVVLPNGVNLGEIETQFTKKQCREKLSLDACGKIILFLGSLIGYKSPNLLLEALPLILERNPDARLVFVGDGPLRNDLERRAAELGVAEKVSFKGYVYGDLKPLYLKAADVLVLPSTMNTEVFPVVLLEASAAALPMVVSSLPTLRCVIEDGKNGIITPTGDVRGLAEGICRLLSDTELRERMGAYARNKINDYTWERIAQETEEVYRTVLTGS